MDGPGGNGSPDRLTWVPCSNPLGYTVPAVLELFTDPGARVSHSKARVSFPKYLHINTRWKSFGRYKVFFQQQQRAHNKRLAFCTVRCNTARANRPMYEELMGLVTHNRAWGYRCSVTPPQRIKSTFFLPLGAWGRRGIRIAYHTLLKPRRHRPVRDALTHAILTKLRTWPKTPQITAFLHYLLLFSWTCIFTSL